MPKPARRWKRVVMGGTFDRLHAGHEALLATAFEHGEEVGIGITTDEFLRERGRASKLGRVRPLAERQRSLQAFLDGRFPGRMWYLIPLVDRWGAALEPGTQALALSDETLPVGELANRLRRRRHLPPLHLLLCHVVLAEDLLRVSSTRVRQGRIDGEGRRLTPLRVAVGSKNQVKHAGVESAFHDLLPRIPLVVEDVSVGAPNPQPWGLEEGFRGATRRAERALASGADWGVGVEATALRVDEDHDVLDLHCIALRGSDGTSLRSVSTGYPLPREVTSRLQDRTTLEAAIRTLGGPARAGHTHGGALAYLTANELSREEMIRAAVHAAFVPLLARRAGRFPASEVLSSSRGDRVRRRPRRA